MLISDGRDNQLKKVTILAITHEITTITKGNNSLRHTKQFRHITFHSGFVTSGFILGLLPAKFEFCRIKVAESCGMKI